MSLDVQGFQTVHRYIKIIGFQIHQVFHGRLGLIRAFIITQVIVDFLLYVSVLENSTEMNIPVEGHEQLAIDTVLALLKVDLPCNKMPWKHNKNEKKLECIKTSFPKSPTPHSSPLFALILDICSMQKLCVIKDIFYHMV